MSVLCVMVVQILSGLAVVVLPVRTPSAFAAAAFKLGRDARLFWGIGLIICSSGFIVAGLMGDVVGAAIYMAACAAGAALYGMRRAMLHRRGVRIEDLLLRRAIAAPLANHEPLA
jgi:hypothetical protein